MTKTILKVLIGTLLLADLGFAAPPSLEYLVGKWDAHTSFYGEEGWENSVKIEAIANTYLNGSFTKMQLDIPFPGALFKFEINFSYDRFNEEYRVVFMDDINAYLDVYRGKFEEDVLIVENTSSGTAFPDGNGGYVYGKLQLTSNETRGFELIADVANEVEGPWSPYMKITFLPK